MDPKIPQTLPKDGGTVLFKNIVLNVLAPAIWIDGFASFEYISESTIDLLDPGQHSNYAPICHPDICTAL